MATETCEQTPKPRRRFLRKTMLATGALTLAGIATRFGLSLFSGQTGIWPESQHHDEAARIFSDVRLKGLVASEITNTKDFFNIEISSNPAKVDLNEWLFMVEISVDGGHTWSDAVLKKPLSSYSWVLWGYEWTPRARDLYTIVVRAYDGKGEVQDPRIARAWPAGASGYNSSHVMAGIVTRWSVGRLAQQDPGVPITSEQPGHSLPSRFGYRARHKPC